MRTFRWLTVSELTLQNVQESSCMSITYFRQTTISESDIIQDFELETYDKHSDTVFTFMNALVTRKQ